MIIKKGGGGKVTYVSQSHDALYSQYLQPTAKQASTIPRFSGVWAIHLSTAGIMAGKHLGP